MGASEAEEDGEMHEVCTSDGCLAWEPAGPNAESVAGSPRKDRGHSFGRTGLTSG